MKATYRVAFFYTFGINAVGISKAQTTFAFVGAIFCEGVALNLPQGDNPLDPSLEVKKLSFLRGVEQSSTKLKPL